MYCFGRDLVVKQITSSPTAALFSGLHTGPYLTGGQICKTLLSCHGINKMHELNALGDSQHLISEYNFFVFDIKKEQILDTYEGNQLSYASTVGQINISVDKMSI
jgi:hypothetical protein